MSITDYSSSLLYHCHLCGLLWCRMCLSQMVSDIAYFGSVLPENIVQMFSLCWETVASESHCFRWFFRAICGINLALAIKTDMVVFEGTVNQSEL